MIVTAAPHLLGPLDIIPLGEARVGSSFAGWSPCRLHRGRLGRAIVCNAHVSFPPTRRCLFDGFIRCEAVYGVAIDCQHATGCQSLAARRQRRRANKP